MEDALLLNAVCLHPGARTKTNNLNNIERLAKMVPHVISETEVSEVKDERRLYTVDSEKKLPPSNEFGRVDHH